MASRPAIFDLTWIPLSCK